ncbi:hypothetical protein PROFUN_17151 [Planoprotostelium fungivorum]|uniref:Uncharacterized protein n=1 Tax=Planoprotostelium fungivorum TaxID=1890364 RepID=A0A2P6MME7_9EUKA|nr:hypothetical protein PROFUN_17151 [Planoprotostelium fungivorum]
MTNDFDPSQQESLEKSMVSLLAELYGNVESHVTESFALSDKREEYIDLVWKNWINIHRQQLNNKKIPSRDDTIRPHLNRRRPPFISSSRAAGVGK